MQYGKMTFFLFVPGGRLVRDDGQGCARLGAMDRNMVSQMGQASMPRLRLTRGVAIDLDMTKATKKTRKKAETGSRSSSRISRENVTKLNALKIILEKRSQNAVLMELFERLNPDEKERLETLSRKKK